MPHTNNAEPEDFIDDIALAALDRRRRRREALERGDLGQQGVAGNTLQDRLNGAIERIRTDRKGRIRPLP